MSARAVPRLFVAILSLVLIGTGLAPAAPAAAQPTNWSYAIIREDVLVQDCRGPANMWDLSPNLASRFDFEITTSYTARRAIQVVWDYTGAIHPVMERQYVAFVGTAANFKTGRSLDYDGHFTRTASNAQEEFTITDLALHLVPPNADDVTVTVDREITGRIDNPEAVLLAYAPRGLNMNLCGYFAGLELGG